MRLSRSLCAVIGESLRGSHSTLDSLFTAAGAPGEPPGLSHGSKWKEWLFRAGQDPEVDSLEVLGNVLEEFMDLAPAGSEDEHQDWKIRRARVEHALEENNLRYYRFGRVLPQGVEPAPLPDSPAGSRTAALKPATVDDLLEITIRGLRRAMHPLTHRRKGMQPLSFRSEYDVQDLLHALLRPWISDIRPEEFTPSYAGSSTRMDFLLPVHRIVIETKIVRDRSHAKSVGQELIVDVEHYRKHPECGSLWCVIYDQDNLITNAEGFKKDLQGLRAFDDGSVNVRVFVLQ